MEYKRLPLDSKGQLIRNNVGLTSPKNLVIVKYPKSGSTLSLCDVPKVLIADSEGGTSYFRPSNRVHLIDEAVIDQFKSTNSYGYIPQTIYDLVVELNEANGMEGYWKDYWTMENERDPKKKADLYEALVQRINAMPFPILAIDTITSIVKLSNAAALHELNINIKDVGKRKSDIKKADEYGGVQYIRRKFAEIKRFIETNAAPFVQYHGHVASRKKTLKKAEEDISAVDIALDGLLSTIFTAEASSVCTFWRDEKGCYLDFTKKEESDLGSRALHLSNLTMKIADIVPDDKLRAGERPKTYWSEVYPEIKFS